MNRNGSLALLLAGAAMLVSPAARAQVLIERGVPQVGTVVETPPSVDNGLANGDVKHAGAPSVDNGVANGVVKQPGAPSVGNGIANGSAKSLNLQQ